MVISESQKKVVILFVVSLSCPSQYLQKKHPNYKETKDDTVWTMQQLQDHLIREGHLDRLGKGHDWVMQGENWPQPCSLLNFVPFQT